MANTFSDTDTITLLVTENPKNTLTNGQPAKARARFALYKSGMTVAEYKALVAKHPSGGKGYAAADLIWDTKHGFIKVGVPTNVKSAPVEAEVPAVEVAKPKRERKGKKA